MYSANPLMMPALAAINPADELPVEHRPHCELCGHQGERLYNGVADFVLRVPGNWSLSKCPNSDCGLVWQNPMVKRAWLSRAYENYYTWGTAGNPTRATSRINDRLFPVFDRWSARLLRLNPERIRFAYAYLDSRPPGSLLDVGCGSGLFLSRMRKAGWQVRGTELDPVAARNTTVREQIPVDIGELRDIRHPDEAFDAITGRHVIEHVYDAQALLRECWRLLKPGGRLVMVTPNVESFGHQVYGQYWRGLEQPRHLFLYSRRSLALLACKSGITDTRTFTTAQGASYLLTDSEIARSSGASFGMTARLCTAVWFRNYRENLMVAKRGQDVGEELVLLADKPGTNRCASDFGQ